MEPRTPQNLRFIADVPFDTEHVFTIPPAGIPPEKDCFPAPPAQKPITGSNVHVRRIRTGAYSILRQVDKILEKMVGA
jgi:hypothetical protein